jgi:hypothetical protein
MAALVGALMAGTGCGGVISTVFIIKGTVELAGARAANAENLSTYEYVSAEAYLKKARESHSYADFEHSLRFARLASERAQAARRLAQAQNKPPPPAVGSQQTSNGTTDTTRPPAPAPQQAPPPAYAPPPGYAPQQPPAQPYPTQNPQAPVR